MAIKRNAKTWSDINLLFTAHPSTADITKKVDEEAIKASIRNLISTRHYERPFHPEIGCQIYSVLFELFTPLTRQVMLRTLRDVIEKFEPRVELISIRLDENPDQNDITATITFKILNTQEPITLTTTISRVR